MVTTSTTTSPLKDDGEIWVGHCDIDDLTDAIDGARFERDMFDTSGAQSSYDLSPLLCAGNTSSNTEALDGQPFVTQLLPEQELEAKLLRVDVERVEGDTNTFGNLRLDLSHLLSECRSIVVTTTSKFDVVASRQDG